MVRAGVLGFVAGIPLLGHPPTNDDRYDAFEWGATYAARPSGIVIDQLGLTRFHLVQHGNFRPVGRMMERSQDTVVWVMAEGLGIPVHVSLRVVFAFAMAIMCVAATMLVLLLTEPTTSLRHPAGAAVHLSSMVTPGLLVANGVRSPVVSFADIYLGTVALVLLLAMPLAMKRNLSSGRIGPHEFTGAFVVGIVVASFNEMALLALPLAVVTAWARSTWTLGRPLADFLGSRAARLLVVGGSGFLLVFVPVRVWLASYCATNHCHPPSLPLINAEVPGLLLARTVSWFPVLSWGQAVPGTGLSWLIPTATTLALLLLVALLSVGLSADLREAPSGSSHRGDRALVTIGLLLLLGGASFGALSGYVQTRAFSLGEGWRDSAPVIVGASLIVTVLLARLARCRSYPVAARRFAVATTAMLLSVTLLANAAWTDAARSDVDSIPFTRLSLEMTVLDDGPAGDERRCDLIGHILARWEGDRYLQERLEPSVDTAARKLTGRPFCEG